MTNKALSFGYKVGGKNMRGREHEDGMTEATGSDMVTTVNYHSSGSL